ncbi:hypothetical protein JCM16303_003667 [Sporobolomyces ruberrimus]
MSLQLDRPQGSSLREDGVPPEDSIKPEAGELTTNTPREASEISVKEEDAEHGEDDSVSLPTRALTTIDYMYKPNQVAKQTRPKNPHSTRFPDFPHIPNRIAPHPLDRLSWFRPELSLPPLSHLLTFDDGNSLFDVNFNRQNGSDIGGGAVATVQDSTRLLCYTGWNAPVDHVGEGGPYCVAAPDGWKPNWDSFRRVERAGTPNVHTGRVAESDGSRAKERGKSSKKHDGSMSFFCGGGGGKNANAWRYRGDVKMDKQVEILPEHFAKMGEEEKLQWINYFRFENVVRRFRDPVQSKTSPEPWRSPNGLFDYLSTPGSPKVTITILRVVGYNQDRIEGWMEQRRKRLNSRSPAVIGAQIPDAEEEKSSTRANREKSSKSTSQAVCPLGASIQS